MRIKVIACLGVVALGIAQAAGAQESREWQYTYNSLGQVSSKTKPTGETVDFQYDSTGNRTARTNALGQTTQYLDHDAMGRVGRIVDPNGVETLISYDARGRVVRRETAGRVTTYEYDRSGNLVRVTQPGGAWVRQEYNAGGELVALETHEGHRIEYVLDSTGNRIEERIVSASGEVTRETFREFDAESRLVEEINGVGDVSRFEYDADGNRLAVEDGNGHEDRNQYDALDRLVASTDALDNETGYARNALDQLESVTDPAGNTTSYDRNIFGDLLELDSPDAGVTSYEVDSAGRTVAETDARGIRKTYQYDALGRVTQIGFPDSSENIAFTYDEGTNGTGRVTRIDDASGSTEYTYTAHGEVATDTRTIDGQTLSVEYAYDETGAVTQMVYPSGMIVDVTVDDSGRPRSVTAEIPGTEADGGPPGQDNRPDRGRGDPPGHSQPPGRGNAPGHSGGRRGHERSNGRSNGRSGGSGESTEPRTVTLAENVAYLPFGPVTSLTYGNGETLSHEYDKAYRLVSLQDGPVSRTLTYDGAGNIVAIDEADSTGQSFGYDAVDRLVDASGSYGSRGYEYEEVGNRTLLDEDGNLTSYQYAPDSNRLTQAGSRAYQYDAAGNMISDGERTFEYNQRGRFSAVYEGGFEIATYEYNALGQRVLKETGEGVIRFVYNQDGQLIGEYDEAGDPIREYVYLQGRPFAMISEGQVYYYHVDHLGTPQQLSDESRVTSWQAEYAPFGRADVLIEHITQRLRFPGHYHDSETGLNYNYHRYYDVQTGRYTRSDPIGVAGGFNLFAYVDNNPIVYRDFYGLIKEVLRLQVEVFEATWGVFGGPGIEQRESYELRVHVDDDCERHVQESYVRRLGNTSAGVEIEFDETSPYGVSGDIGFGDEILTWVLYEYRSPDGCKCEIDYSNSMSDYTDYSMQNFFIRFVRALSDS